MNTEYHGKWQQREKLENEREKQKVWERERGARGNEYKENRVSHKINYSEQ